MGYTAIVDYGVGNLKSIVNAMDYLGLSSKITGQAGELEKADALILPGVGAFPDAADKLRASGLDRVVIAQAERKPVLGICLGMQLLFDRGEEGRPCEGLGLVAGTVEKIATDQKLPHIGWNSLTFPNPSPLFRGVETFPNPSPLFRGVEPGSYVYFVHTFCALPARPGDVLAVTDYGGPVTAAVGRGNVYGCQFHPEKSGETGLQILRNFGELNK